MKKHLTHTALFVLIFFLFSCKKEKKDTASPTLTVSSPTNGQPFLMYDTIQVSGHVSDETQLSSVLVALTDANNTLLQSSYSVPISGKDFVFNIKYVLTQYHLSTGYYYLSVTANDGSNTTQRSIKIHITESPTVKTGYFIVGASQPKLITRYDAAFVMQPFTITLTTGFNGMAFGPYYQQLYINSNINQPFIGYDAVTNSTAWSFPYAGGSLPYTTCVSTDGERAFMGYYVGSIRAINYMGGNSTLFYNASTNYYPSYFTLTSANGLAVLTDKTSGPTKLQSFYKTSGAGLNSAFFPYSVTGIFERTQDEMYVLGNDGAGQAILYTYNVLTNGLIGGFVLPPGKLLSAAQVDADFLLLAMDDGHIYGYRFSNGNTGSLANLKAQKIIYNSKTAEVCASSKNSLYSYSLSSNYALILNGFNSVADSIIAFEVITNK